MGNRRRCLGADIFSIDEPDGIVTVRITEAEMGQHVGTALARILAEELEVAWDDVRLEYIDSDPKWGLMVTGGSLVNRTELLSRAGAAGASPSSRPERSGSASR